MTYETNPRRGIVYGLSGKPITKTNGRGYVQVSYGGQFVALAHRLIWESVFGPIPRGLEINHKNGVKTDNRIRNLEAVTRSENMRHAYRLGLR